MNAEPEFDLATFVAAEVFIFLFAFGLLPIRATGFLFALLIGNTALGIYAAIRYSE